MLLHNPVADLSSYQFLIFYAAVCALVLVLLGWVVRSSDTTAAAGSEPLPRNLQAYEIAYLRGDVNELVRFVVFDLTRGGALELVPGARKRAPQIQRTGMSPERDALSAPAQIVYDYFAAPHTAGELFKSDVPASVAAAYSATRLDLESRGLFAPAQSAAASRSARIAGVAVIAGLGAYRLWYAAAMHHGNVLFLIAIGIVSLVLLLVVTTVPRLSKRGVQYLRMLRGALPVSRDRLVPASDSFPLIIAAGGMAALSGTPYEGLGTTFRRQARADVTSTSAGCGAGSDGTGCGSGGGGSCGGGGGCGG